MIDDDETPDMGYGMMILLMDAMHTEGSSSIA